MYPGADPTSDDSCPDKFRQNLLSFKNSRRVSRLLFFCRDQGNFEPDQVKLFSTQDDKVLMFTKCSHYIVKKFIIRVYNISAARGKESKAGPEERLRKLRRTSRAGLRADVQQTDAASATAPGRFKQCQTMWPEGHKSYAPRRDRGRKNIRR